MPTAAMSSAASQPRVSSVRVLLASALLLAGGALLVCSPATAQDLSAGSRPTAPSPPGERAPAGRAVQPAGAFQPAGLLQPRLRALPSQPETEPEATSPPPYRHRWDAFRGELAGSVLAAGAIQGTLMHLGGHPGRWGQGTGGYLARIGSGVGVQLVNRGVHHGLAAALDLRLETPDSRQGALGNRSLGARVGQAALQPLTTWTESGQRVPAVGSLSGSYAAILAQRRMTSGQWKPGQAAVGMAIATGVEVALEAGSELVEAL